MLLTHHNKRRYSMSVEKKPEHRRVWEDYVLKRRADEVERIEAEKKAGTYKPFNICTSFWR